MKTRQALKTLRQLMPSFKKGDTVTWTSQASGFKKKKTGKVVGVIMAGYIPGQVNEKFYFRGFGVKGRPHRSYIVDVNGKLYWPLVKYLKLKGGR